MKVDEYVKKYEMMAGADLPEDLKATVIIDLCIKDLKERLELSSREMTYKQVRDATTSDLKAMEVDDVEDDYMWWCGMEHDEEQWDQHFSEELHSLGRTKGVGKGGCKGWNKGGRT